MLQHRGKSKNSQERNPSPKGVTNGIHRTDNERTLLGAMRANLIRPCIDNSRNAIRRSGEEESKELEANGHIPNRNTMQAKIFSSAVMAIKLALVL